MKRFNLIAFVSDHLFGENHCHAHKMGAGIIVVGFAYGVYTVFICVGLAAVGDIAKDLIVGVGVAPYVEPFMKRG